MESSHDINFTDYYALLGIAPSAEIADIRKAYIAKAKEHHPDAGGATETMQELNKAYKTLTSSTKKAAYDMLHSFHTGTTGPKDYRYGEGRAVNDVADMTDDEIDAFLDDVFTEFRNKPQNTKQGVRQWFKKLF